MSVLAEVAKDLVKMFVADMRMSAAALATVGLAWAASSLGHAPGLATGLILALGCVAVLLAGVAAAARSARASRTEGRPPR